MPTELTKYPEPRPCGGSPNIKTRPAMENSHNTILVAEDEAPIRENIVRMLRIEGYLVLPAANGREALALAREHLPDVVIADSMMPEMDGPALLQALRDDPLTASLPFIFLTARAERSDIRAGMNLGADDYLTKPFLRDELLGAVRTRLARAVGERRKTEQLAQQARRLAYFDALTGLPNRTLLQERLDAAIYAARRGQFGLALIAVGLDGFRSINDSLGHASGDRFLHEIADRLFALVYGTLLANPYDCLARLAGDRFAVLLVGFSDDNYLDSFSRRIVEAIAEPFKIDGQDLYLTASAGVAQLPAEQQGAVETLLRNAEIALHKAKEAGPGSHRFFAEEMNQNALRRLQLNGDLYKAVSNGELLLYYQPQVEIASGTIVGFEALMRWRHPQLGFISPGEFIPVAEEGGAIVHIGEWALREACRQAKTWIRDGLGPVSMAVNLSARQFMMDGIERTVAAVLAESGLPPEFLKLEITESIALLGVGRVLETLTALKALGVSLAMDDFGTGYSSLSYLKRFPIDVLKVDQSFIRNITTDPGDAAITRAVVAMAHSFGMSVIAEGVETLAQLDFLRDLGCEEFQGYYFSKPLPAKEAEALLQAQIAQAEEALHLSLGAEVAPH